MTNHKVNAADPEQIREATAKEKLMIDQEAADMKAVLETPQGRRMLWRFMEASGVYTQSAVQSGSWTYFNEGRRCIGNMILSKILQAGPEYYLQMMNENKENKK